jgi:antitoxin (DNA-binding transcriptional repressor) of toxin-antitoxin stability system
MKNAIAVKDLRKNLSAITDRVEKGESFDVFRRSKLCARIVPADVVLEDEWQTIVDFSDTKNPKGESITDILSSLESMNHG